MQWGNWNCRWAVVERSSRVPIIGHRKLYRFRYHVPGADNRWMSMFNWLLHCHILLNYSNSLEGGVLDSSFDNLTSSTKAYFVRPARAMLEECTVYVLIIGNLCYKGQHARSKGHTSLLILVPPCKNVNKPTNLTSAIMLMWFITYSWFGIGPIRNSKLSYL